MFRGSVLGCVSRYVSGVCFGVCFAQFFYLLIHSFGGLFRGSVSGVCFAKVELASLTWRWSPQKIQTHINTSARTGRCKGAWRHLVLCSRATNTTWYNSCKSRVINQLPIYFRPFTGVYNSICNWWRPTLYKFLYNYMHTAYCMPVWPRTRNPPPHPPPPCGVGSGAPPPLWCG